MYIMCTYKVQDCHIASNYGPGVYFFKAPITHPKVALNLRLIAIKVSVDTTKVSVVIK